MSNHIQSGTTCINFVSDFHFHPFFNTCKLFPYQFYLFFERGLASSNCQLILMSLHLVAQINLKKALYFSVNVFKTEELIGDAIFTSPT